MQDEPTPSYAPECRARTLRGTQDAPLGFAICQTPASVVTRLGCKFSHDLGFSIVVCRHPRYAEIVARTLVTRADASNIFLGFGENLL